ncbi:class II aldolase/adducin family protein [Rathayibacter sp. Leaf296]|uniref:class II aldolase/adducin family protein n=1 Tax=Rathayibacter sp. Leaf296 TaxID=1736327 RepID=UPI000A9C762B|nr:class II aldolase/adducin family protein [Rathayibacter sp. Leaf296]
MSAPILHEAERASVVALAQRMVRDRLVVGTSGNISLRVGEHLVVTPSGLDYDTMRPEDVVVTDLTGAIVDGSLKPTVELPFHLECVVEHGAQAVVHTHSAAATALSLLRRDVPAVHYQLAMFGGSVQVAPYATFGTPELVANISAALAGRSACIIEHHGTLAYGDTLQKAYDRARQLEWVCDVWLRASSVGLPSLLSQAEMEKVTELFGGYGQTRPA